MSDVCVGIVNMKGQIEAQAPTSPSPIADEKVQAVVTENVFGDDAELSRTARPVFKHPWTAMKCMCIVYKVMFQSLLESMEQRRENTSDGVPCVASYPPSDTRRIAECTIFGAGSAKSARYARLWKSLSPLMGMSAHAHVLFCIEGQDMIWRADRGGKEKNSITKKTWTMEGRLTRQQFTQKWVL